MQKRAETRRRAYRFPFALRRNRNRACGDGKAPANGRINKSGRIHVPGVLSIIDIARIIPCIPEYRPHVAISTPIDRTPRFSRASKPKTEKIQHVRRSSDLVVQTHVVSHARIDIVVSRARKNELPLPSSEINPTRSLGTDDGRGTRAGEKRERERERRKLPW